MMEFPIYDEYGNDGTFPYTCTMCGVECETPKELADPDHHDETSRAR